MRDDVRQGVGEEYLVKLYQVHDHFSEIDFDSLPQSFVLKTNHDSGTVILVRDKSQLDYQATAERIEVSLKNTYGWASGEWAYSYIEPKVFVEEFIEPENNSPPPDFKMQCVDGEMKFCRYTYDRGIDTKEIVLDKYANNFGFLIDENFKLGDKNDFKKPKLWEKMIFLAETLSKDFKCVRVDLYCSKDQIYVGEMTFFPMMGCYKGEGQKKLGKYLDFDRTTFKPFILDQLKKS
ncbi:glycosyltransferase [Geminocystis sp. NIES-3709]|nr:glycosyltransferase [Geminocystis sp. NIES-3709]